MTKETNAGMDVEVLDELTQEEENAVNNAADEILNDTMSSDGVWSIKLSRPVLYNGTELTELHFNFGKLTGEDALKIEDELVTKGRPTFLNEVASARYLMMIAAKACEEKIMADLFNKMSIRDFNKIKNKTQLFMLGVAI